MKVVSQPLRTDGLVVAAVVLGLILRFWAIDWGLPFVLHPDEPTSINGALRMLRTGDLNPHFFHWGSLLHYLNLVLYLFYFLLGKLTGRFTTPLDVPLLDMETIAVGWAPDPTMFLLSRLLVATAGVASILVIYWAGQELGGRTVGTLAAFLLALAPSSVTFSHIVKTDILLVLFSLVSLLGSLRIVREPTWRNYVLAGIGAGLATSAKYNAALILIALVVAHVLALGARRVARREMAIGILAAALAFVATSPYALLDFAAFREALVFDAVHYATRHAGAEGNSLQWYTSFLWNQFGLLTLLAWCGVFYLAARHSKTGAVLYSFPIVYLLFVSRFTVHFEATILPIVPFVILLASVFLVTTYRYLAQRVPHRTTLRAISLAAGGLLAAPLLFASMDGNLALAREDDRAAARLWIAQNLPEGARIALEPYAPFVDHTRFVVEGFEDMTARSPDWYAQNGFEYLVFSYGSYGRFFENPDAYPDYVSRYNALFTRFGEVARFAGSGTEIRIHKTDTAALPRQRASVRLGVYAPMIEFVGYDRNAPGDFVLYWRALEARREPLKLTVRVLDRADRAVAQSSADLYAPGARWQEGIVRLPWKIPLMPAPGLYRLQLELDAEGVGRLPVLSHDYRAVSDKIFTAPFKIPPAPPDADELARARSLSVAFGDTLQLLAFSIEKSNVTLYWTSVKQTEKDYTVFVHLVDREGKVRAQVDSQPRGGAYPTSLWDPGEIIRDEYRLALPNDLAPGAYELRVGMYEYPSLTRLDIADSAGRDLGDYVVLSQTIEVGP